MMNFLVLVGLIGIPIGILLGGYFGHRWWTKDPNAVLVKEWLARYRTWEQLIEDWGKPQKSLDEVVEETRRPNLDIQLEQAKELQGVQLIGTDETSIEKAVTLKPQTQKGGKGPWLDKNEDPSVAKLIAGEWFLKIPKGERLPRAWLRGIVISERSRKSLTDYFMGEKESPGPARQFNRLKQDREEVVRFMGGDLPQRGLVNLPDDFNSIEFQMLDLGAFKVVEGDCPEMRSDDVLFSITARETGGQQRWLVYLDAREEFARGSGILLLLESFSPDAEIKSLF